MLPLAAAENAGEAVQTGVIDVVGWALVVGGIVVTVLWLRTLTR